MSDDYDDTDYDDYEEDDFDEEEELANITDTPVASLEAGLDHQRAFILSSKGSVNFSVLFENVPDTGFSVHQRIQAPCYGPMRAYGEDSDRPKDPKPGDFADRFPRVGNPVAVALPFAYNTYSKVSNLSEEFVSTVFDPESSPWRALLTDFELVIADGIFKGVILRNTHVDPTLIVHFAMFLRTYISGSLQRFDDYVRKFPNADRRVILILHWLIYSVPVSGTYLQWGYDYYLSPRFSMKNFLNGVTVQQSLDTFYNQSSYNRPDLQDVFGKEEDDIMKRLRPLPVNITEQNLPEIIERLSNLA